jgi:HEAT repeat protein
MRNISKHLLTVFLLFACFLFLSLGTVFASQSQQKALSQEEQKEFEFIKSRCLQPRYRSLIDWSSRSLIHHQGDEKEIQGTLASLKVLWEAFADSEKIPKLVESGGVKAFKSNMAKSLKSKDSYVRCFGAIMLAVTGDTTYKTDIARLLESKHSLPTKSEDKRLSADDNPDSFFAIMALGLLSAKEYVPKVSTFLSSSESLYRLAALSALGYMGAREYIGDIAKLLDDPDGKVQEAAVEALSELDAKEYSKRITAFLMIGRDDKLAVTACYSLARLNAKEHAKELAQVVNKGSLARKGAAAKSLALLEANEYTQDIAQLIEDNDPGIRVAALTALGIFNNKDYLNKIATHLQDKEIFVRFYAAIALLLMGDQTHSREILDIVQSAWKDDLQLREYYFNPDIKTYLGYKIGLHVLVTERKNQLANRATKAWERLNQVRQ